MPLRAGGKFGGEAANADPRDITPAGFAAIDQAWIGHLVPVLRGQTISDPDLITFSPRFGMLDHAPARRRHARDHAPHQGQQFGTAAGPTAAASLRF